MISRHQLFWIALLACAIGLMPPSLSPYQVTGEENVLAQARGMLQWFYTAIRPAPKLAPFAVQPTGIETAFGVNTFLQIEALPEVRDESLQKVHTAGFRLIRQQFVWEDIEIAEKGDFVDKRNLNVYPDGIDAWLKYDNIVDLAEANEIEILARLDNPPAWSRALTNTVGTLAPPDNLTDYGDYVEAVVTRYKGRIRYYQLWNEPNIYPEWGEQGVNPEAFSLLMCEGYKRAKAADPDAIILSGTMAPTVALNYRDLNDLVYLERIYASGGGDCFDVLSVQGYGLFSGATDQRLRPTVINYPHNLYLRDVMVTHGDGHKPIWISELGWNVVPDGMAQNFGQVSEAEQAKYSVEAFERIQTEWPWVEVGAYWFFKEAGEDRSQAKFYFRLMDPDFMPLPVYDALVDGLQNIPAAGSPSWLFFAWQASRRWFALVGGGLLFWLFLDWGRRREQS
jgi:hypothetical protein